MKHNISQDEFIRSITIFGIQHSALRYKCSVDDIFSQLSKFKKDTIIVPNINVKGDEFIYLYKRKNITVISRNLGESYSDIIEKLKANNIHYIYKKDEYISVDKEEIRRLLSQYNIEKVSKKLNVYQHKIVQFLNLKVRD